MDPFEQALKFIQVDRLDEARIYFEELLKQDPDNEEILYNLGMLYTELGRPYRNTPFSKKGKQLMQLTEKDYVNSYEGDRSMIDRWAEFLGLSKWYSWVGFEDVPPDYLNAV